MPKRGSGGEPLDEVLRLIAIAVWLQVIPPQPDTMSGRKRIPPIATSVSGSIGGVMMTSLEVPRIHQMSDSANELRQQLANFGQRFHRFDVSFLRPVQLLV
jgi:hypothetical protein